MTKPSEPVVTPEDEVRTLVIAYAERLDAGDLDGVAALFERGRFRSGRDGTVREGAAAVREMYDPVILYEDGTPKTKHVLGNVVVEIEDVAGTANASCTFTVLQAEHGLQPVLAGRYIDTFARAEDGRWHFTERTVHPDLMGDLSMHMRFR